jgi:hypothetical protein
MIDNYALVRQAILNKDQVVAPTRTTAEKCAHTLSELRVAKGQASSTNLAGVAGVDWALMGRQKIGVAFRLTNCRT